MFLSSSTYNYTQRVNFCNWTIEDHWKDFFLSEHRSIFKVLPYHIVITIFVEWVNIALTLAWNYMDIFIMVISIAVVTRFQQLNERLSTFQKKVRKCI